ncbi:MAG: site-specific integrase [Muribaculaceae bacterium]|nr:site-specific integrase [Muribaculaceae bacterium]
MFTYRFFHKTKGDTVALRIGCNRRKAELSLGLCATAEDLADSLSSSPSSKNIILARTLAHINVIIRQLQCEYLCDGKVNQDVKITMIDIKRRLKIDDCIDEPTLEQGESDPNNLFARFFAKTIRAKSNEGYRVSCDYTYKKMADYCNWVGEDFNCLTFDDITLSWLRSFDEWLTKCGAAQNSRNIHFRNIRTAINLAIDEELTDNYPFRRFKIKQEETRKRSLSLEEMRILISYPCDEFQKFYRDMFVLSFLLIGINPIDLFNLTQISPDGRIHYRRAKTHKLYSVKVEPEAMEIIERWRGKAGLVCPADRWASHLSFTKNANIALKKIGKYERSGRGGKKAITPEWPELSMYWARHTWATIAYSLDIPYDTIAQALGHKNSGPSVTATYIRLDEKKVDAANRKVIDYVLYGK